MKKGLGALIVLGLSLLICDVGYSDPSQTPQPTFDEQLSLCEKEAHTLIGNPDCAGDKCTLVTLGVLIQKNNFVKACMKSHGHEIQYPEKKKP